MTAYLLTLMFVGTLAVVSIVSIRNMETGMIERLDQELAHVVERPR